MLRPMFRYGNLLLAALGGILMIGMGGCGGDEASETSGSGSTTSGAGSSTTASSGGGAAGIGGGGSASGSGGSGAAGSGGAAGFPWDGAIDPAGGAPSTRLTRHELGTTTAPQGFYQYVPPGYPAGVKWPLLVALHGVGENGNGQSELGNVIDVGIGKLLANDAWPNDRPFVVLVPQHPGGGCPSASEIHAFMSWALASYAIDPRYVYLTGLSCGAIGSWAYLDQQLDSQIAAFVPVAGDGKSAWNDKGCELAKVAIWAFHGDADGTVDVSGTNVPLDGLASCPSPPAKEIKKTIYPGVGHNSWDMTYDLSAGHDIYTWMLGFTKAP